MALMDSGLQSYPLNAPIVRSKAVGSRAQFQTLAQIIALRYMYLLKVVAKTEIRFHWTTVKPG